MTKPSADNPSGQPLGLPLNDQLGPEERAKLDALLDHIHEYGTTAEGVLLRAAQLCQAARAAERERCDVLTDDMLRYAMAAMGAGSPREADNLRTFWRFAIEARNTKA